MPEPLRVAMIIQGYLPKLGGAEQQLAGLAPRLMAAGVEVHVLTRRYPGLEKFEIINGVPVHRLPIPGPKLFDSLVFMAAALRLLARLQPDVIHAHELLSPTTTALAARRLLGVPVVAKVLRGGELGDLARLRRNPLSATRIPAMAREVDRFIVISREIDRELAEIGVPTERRVFIPNGVDTQRFIPAAEEQRRALRASLGAPQGAVVLYAGRLSPEKNLHLLANVWQSLHNRFPTAELWIVGKGEEENTLRGFTSAGVRLLGYQPDVLPYLQAADLFVLPSQAEGLSNALLEALACGLPVVATAVGGSVDVIETGRNGLLVPPGDAAALQGALQALLSDPQECSQLGQNDHATRSLDQTASALVALYREVALDRRNQGRTHS
jgi:glycosyltransferase involved in cell wall biosynthesis